MKKYFVLPFFILAVGFTTLRGQTAEPRKTGNEWHAAGDAIPRSKAFSDDMKKQLALDDATTKKVFQLYLANTKSVDEIKLSSSTEDEKRNKLQSNTVDFNEKLKDVLTPEQYKKYMSSGMKVY